jgi:hypothetical protein
VLVKKISWDYGDVSAAINAATNVTLDIYHPHGGWPGGWPKPKSYKPSHTPCSCGTGIIREDGALRSWGRRFERITFADWKNQWLTKGYGGQLVTICDPKPEGPGEPEEEPEPPQEVIDKQMAKEIADQFLQNPMFMDDPAWQDAIQGTTIGDPILVDRLDAPGLKYYVVPWDTEPDPSVPENRTPVLARIDAYGRVEIAGSVAVPKGTTVLGGRWTRDRVAQEYGGSTIATVDGVEVLLDPNDLMEDMVWTPCIETGYSLDVPFWVFKTSGVNVYVRIDGELFTEFTGGVS